jgi:general secretion pathway protein M
MSAGARFWVARNERERRILLAGSAVLLLLLVWLLLIEPALAGRSNWQERLPALRAERAQMQALARQVSAAPPPARAQQPWDRPALERSLADAGLRPQSLNVGDVLVRANFNDVSFSALTGWLQQSQRNAQLAVSEANVSARERVDRVDATLALRRLP